MTYDEFGKLCEKAVGLEEALEIHKQYYDCHHDNKVLTTVYFKNGSENFSFEESYDIACSDCKFAKLFDAKEEEQRKSKMKLEIEFTLDTATVFIEEREFTEDTPEQCIYVMLKELNEMPFIIVSPLINVDGEPKRGPTHLINRNSIVHLRFFEVK